MPTINFPEQLPAGLRSGYGVQHAETLVRTSLQTGRARQRRAYTSVPSMVSVSWLMTEGQARLFEAFYRHGLADGAEWFNCPLITPTGLKPYECRFSAMYTGPELVGVRHWRFSAELEIKERETFPAEWLAYPEWIMGPGLLDLAISELPEA
jgi:hypothetical protein